MLKALVRNFVTSDLEEINTWLADRGLNKLEIKCLPRHGKIVDGLAVGFLIQTDTQTAIIDFYISNSKADKADTNKALDEITFKLISEANALGFKNIKCTTQIMSIRDRAKKLGFKYLGEFSTYIKEC